MYLAYYWLSHANTLFSWISLKHFLLLLFLLLLCSCSHFHSCSLAAGFSTTLFVIEAISSYSKKMETMDIGNEEEDEEEEEEQKTL